MKKVNSNISTSISSILPIKTPSILPLFEKMTSIIDYSEKKSKLCRRIQERQRYLEIEIKAMQVYGSLFSQYKIEDLQLQLNELKENLRKKEIKH